jgi:hypothetical protein
MTSKPDEDEKLRDVKNILRHLQQIANTPGPAGDAVAPKVSTGILTDATPKSGDTPRPSANSIIDSIVAKGESAARSRSEAAQAKPAVVKPVATGRPVRQKHLGALALAMIALGAVAILGGDLIFKYWPSSTQPKRTAAPAPEAIKPPPAAPVKAGLSSAPAAIPVPAVAVTPARKPQEKPQEKPAEPLDCEAGTIAGNVMMDTPEAITANARQLMDNGHVEAARKMLLQRPIAATQDGAWLLARSYDPNFLTTVASGDATPDKKLAENWYRCWHDIGVRNGMVMNDKSLRRMIDAMR